MVEPQQDLPGDQCPGQGPVVAGGARQPYRLPCDLLAALDGPGGRTGQRGGGEQLGPPRRVLGQIGGEDPVDALGEPVDTGHLLIHRQVDRVGETQRRPGQPVVVTEPLRDLRGRLQGGVGRNAHPRRRLRLGQVEEEVAAERVVGPGQPVDQLDRLLQVLHRVLGGEQAIAWAAARRV